MKEPPTALLLRHNVDRLSGASSASSKNGSLAPLLNLHSSVVVTNCGAQTDAAPAAQVERVAYTLLPPTGQCSVARTRVTAMPLTWGWSQQQPCRGIRAPRKKRYMNIPARTEPLTQN